MNRVIKDVLPTAGVETKGASHSTIATQTHTNKASQVQDKSSNPLLPDRQAVPRQTSSAYTSYYSVVGLFPINAHWVDCQYSDNV